MSLLRAKSRLRRLRYVRDCGHSGVAAPRLDGNSLVLRPRCLKIRGIVPEGNTLGVPHQRARWFAMTERFLTAPFLHYYLSDRFTMYFYYTEMHSSR